VKVNHGSSGGAWVKADGSFVVEGIEKGSYILMPSVPGYTVASVSLSPCSHSHFSLEQIKKTMTTLTPKKDRKELTVL
jgi:hypothetical protein